MTRRADEAAEEPTAPIGGLANRRRGLLLGAVLGIVIASAGAGWAAASQIRSPAELAAAAEAPEPSNITVGVVRQVLSADVVTRADLVYDEPKQVALSGSFAGSVEALVVTKAVEVDTQLSEGDVAVEVTGRPVFLLEGEIPMYRDLRPGATGEDVLQLERALARMELLGRDPGETWDDATGAAVAAWYAEAGYLPNGLSEEDEAALASARDRVRSARAAVTDAQSAAAEMAAGPDRSAVLSADAEVRAARDAASLAELDAKRARSAAADNAEDAASERAAARSRHEQAVKRLTAAEGGTHPDTDEKPTGAELRELQDAVAAEAAAVRAAERAVTDAGFEVERVTAEQAAMVRQAADRVSVAEAMKAELGGSSDDGGMARQVELAQEEATAADQDLARLERDLGTWLPAGEAVFIAALPVRVDQVAVSRGSVIEGSFITVSGSDLALRSSVLERDAGLLEVGMEVVIEDPSEGGTIIGTISEVADRAGTRNVGADRVYVEMTSEEPLRELVGMNLRVTIAVNSTAGEVLAVPAAALSATVSGATRVEVEDADGQLRSVQVETGLSAAGLVEVTPLDGDLSDGDQVVVGRDSAS